LFTRAKAQSNQTVANGSVTTAVNFPGTGCVYSWVNDTPGIGLAASGAGTNIASFVAVNKGNSPVTATITVAPIFTGYAYITNYGSNSVSVINTATNADVATIPVGSLPIGISVSPDGTLVYVTNLYSDDISVISTATNTVVSTIPTLTEPYSVSVSPDGSRIYVGYAASDNVSVFNTATNALITAIPGGQGLIYEVVVSPDGSKVYASGNGTIGVINTANNAVISSIAGASGGMAISPDNKTLYAVADGTQSKTVAVINTATNVIIDTIGVGGDIYDLAISPDESRLYVTSISPNTFFLGTVTVINTATNAIIAQVPIGPGSFGISVSPDGSQVYVPNDDSPGTVSVISTATNTVIANVPVGLDPISHGKFITGGTGCSTTPLTFTITVNPGTASPPAISAGIATGVISACTGTTSASPDIQRFAVSGNNLTENITAIAPTGFEVSLSPTGGYADSVTLVPAGDSVSSTLVYVRSAASASAGIISGNVAITSPGATTQYVAVVATVNALPTVNPVNNQTVLNGDTTTTVNFTGTGNTFIWANDAPGIGLPANGAGNIVSFKAINTGSSPITATITATPVNAAFAYIANLGDNTVSVVNTLSDTVVTTIPVGQGPVSVSVSPDGSRVYVANSTAGTISVISTATNTVTATVTVGSFPNYVYVSPDGSLIYAVNQTNISVINALTNMVVSTITAGNAPQGVAESSDGSKLFIACENDNDISVINTATSNVINSIQAGSDPTGIVLSPDGSKLYVANYGSDTVSVINTATNIVVATVPVGINPFGISISPDGLHVYVTNVGSKSLSVINTSTDSVIATVQLYNEPSGVSLSADGSMVYVTDYGYNTVSVINAATNAIIATITVGVEPNSHGNFVTPGMVCSGMPVTFTITVNPTPVSQPNITSGPVTGNIFACLGNASASPNIEQFTVFGHNLTGNITATAPSGFEVSLAATSGYGNSLTVTVTGDSISTVIYLRSSANASGVISGNVVLSSPGALGQNVMVTATINALPGVNNLPNQTVFNGDTTYTINFTGSANTFAWTNNLPGIGLAAAGTGIIPSFKAVNTGNSPITATITVTPVLTGFAYIADNEFNTVSVINTTTDSVVATIPVGKAPFAVSVSPDGTRAYVCNWNSNNVSVINTATNAVITSIAVGDQPFGIVVSPNGTRAYVADNVSNSVSVINTTTNVVISTITVGPAPYGICISPDGSSVYIANSNGASVSVISTASNKVVNTIPLPSNAIGIAVSPDGSTLYAANTMSNTISVINIKTNADVTLIQVAQGTPVSVTVSPDGSLLYVASQVAGTISVFNTSTNALVTIIKAGPSVFGISLSPDGSRLYVPSGYNSVLVINTLTNAVIETVTVGASPDSFGNFVTSGTGCSGTPVTFTITVIPSSSNNTSDSVIIPNAFTPNGDGINDTWDIKNIGSYPNCTINIYDRYGGKVFSSIGYGVAWDGRNGSANVPQGTYYYIINLQNGQKVLSGLVTIIRN